MRRAVPALAAAVLLAGCGGAAHRAAPARPAPTATPTASVSPTGHDGGDITIGDIERANRRRARRHATPTPTAVRTAAPVAISRPPITPAYIPFPAKRKAEMTAYAERHYGEDTYRLTDPKVIVEHFTATSTAQAAIDIFADDVPDTELHELPATCAHYLVDTDGTILALVPTTIMCRHTVGLNDVAIGIEHVGTSDAQVLGDAAQMKSSLALTRWLQNRYGIATRNVIGHNESLSSPYHHENVPALRTQTHEDMTKATMDRYRARLATP